MQFVSYYISLHEWVQVKGKANFTCPLCRNISNKIIQVQVVFEHVTNLEDSSTETNEQTTINNLTKETYKLKTEKTELAEKLKAVQAERDKLTKLNKELSDNHDKLVHKKKNLEAELTNVSKKLSIINE